MTEITAEEVKCSCLGVKQILLAQFYNLQKICLHQFKTHFFRFFFPATGLFLLGLAKNSCREWTTLAKKYSFNSFLLNTA